MAKVLRIDRKQISNGREIITVQRQATKNKPRIKMTQEQAWRIFNLVATFQSPEETYENLLIELPTRRHLTFWLGQVGHRFDVTLGRGRDFNDFLREVANRLWIRSRQSIPSLMTNRKEWWKKMNTGTNQTANLRRRQSYRGIIDRGYL